MKKASVEQNRGLKIPGFSSYWLHVATRIELESFLEFWLKLSHQERLLWVWRDILGFPSGLIGAFLETGDVRDSRVGCCGVTTTGWVYFPESRQVSTSMDELREKWEQWLISQELYPIPVDGRGPLEKRAFEIETAFNCIVSAIVSAGDDNESKGMPGKYTQMRAILFLDTGKLQALLKQWLDENQHVLKQA